MPSWVAWQKAEGALVLMAGIALHVLLGAQMRWWMAVVWFFLPDLSFVAYGAGKRIGAVVYNLWHLYGVGALIFVAGLGFGDKAVVSVGALWLAHAGFDRMMGYGLKSPLSFQDTHLGRIGHAQDKGQGPVV